MKTIEPCERCGIETDQEVIFPWELPPECPGLGFDPVADKVFTKGKTRHYCMDCVDKNVQEHIEANPLGWTTKCIGCDRTVPRTEMVAVAFETDGVVTGSCQCCPKCAAIDKDCHSFADWLAKVRG